MTMKDDRVKERPIMRTPPVNYQHHTDEWKCRQFAAMFPSRDMDEALAWVNQGYDTWHHLYLLIMEGGVRAGLQVIGEVDCYSPESKTHGRLGEPLDHPANFSSWSPEPHELH